MHVRLLLYVLKINSICALFFDFWVSFCCIVIWICKHPRLLPLEEICGWSLAVDYKDLDVHLRETCPGMDKNSSAGYFPFALFHCLFYFPKKVRFLLCYLIDGYQSFTNERMISLMGWWVISSTTLGKWGHLWIHRTSLPCGATSVRVCQE